MAGGVAADIGVVFARHFSVVVTPRMRVLVPFAFMTVFAVVLSAVWQRTGAAWEEWIAAGLTVLLVVLGFVIPWRRLPGWAHPTVPLAYFAVIVLLRDAHGGASSGYGPLCVMPVFWLALFGTRRHLALALAAVAGVFAGPLLLLGGARYPVSEWRTALLWTLVLAIVGYRVQSLVAEVKRRSTIVRASARRLEQHAQELADTQNALRAMAVLAREVSANADARNLICRAAVEGASASLATLVEPDGKGGFYVTGAAGIPIDLPQMRADVRPSASLRAFYASERTFIADVSTNPGVSSTVIEATGLRSIVYEPIVRGDRPVGVLCVGWDQQRPALDERTTAVVSYLAAEAGAAIERSDLVAQLDQLARTDQLTGLPNRRSWDEHLQQEITHTTDGPLCVAILDLDNFKTYNDRYGHLAGDTLLRDAAAAWQQHLRPADLLARLGGEEFAILLPACTLPHATPVLERLRQSTPRSVTCSVGLAEHTTGETAEQLTTRADQALYQAKHEGRNRLNAA